MNKYLCLDVGNVLGRLDMEPFVNALSIATKKSKEDCYFFLSYIHKGQDLGLHSLEDELKVHCNITSKQTLSYLIDVWNNEILKIDEEVLEFLSKLIKNNNLEVAIVSNIGIEHAGRFDRLFSKYDCIKNAIKHFSCDVGARKPTPLYYQILLNMYPEFKGAVYLDDLNENLQTGQSLGFNTLHFDLSKLPSGSLELHYKLKDLENMIVNS